MVAFASRKPDLRLALPLEDREVLTADLEDRYQKKVASDAAYLPRSTNMGLPAHVSTGERYDFDEDDFDRPGKVKTKLPARPCTFKRSIPCLFVPHVPSALPWYKEVLGFAVVGQVDPGRVELHRAHPRAPRGQGGVSLYLRKPPGSGAEVDPTTVPKGSLWIEVDSVDDLYAEMCHKLEKYAQDLTDYFPAHHFGSAKILSKPRNTAWSQREASVVDGYGNTIVFFQDLSR